MNKSFCLFYILLLSATFLLTSCRTSRSIESAYPEIRTLVRAGIRLGMDIDESDYWPLYVESSKWIGVPYRAGGETMSGCDCSGLTKSIVQRIFFCNIQRQSYKQYSIDCTPVSRASLRPGNLVFFSTDNSRGSIAHCGIYLKNGRFIHASSSRGVIVSSLDEGYWKRHWITGGKLKNAF